jgi:demethylmenaquinone methyltransferase/2-methoxy-6-polyprenyl-1,4-benzoquinol methylase
MVGTDRNMLVDLYRKRAEKYDLYAKLYPLVGFHPWRYRKTAIQKLGLRRGDTVVDIGCGTGLNFALLQQAIGPEGSIIGVDLTDAMLAQARDRVHENGWHNVKLVQSDAAQFRYPHGVDGIISTFAITLVPEFDQVIRSGCEALKPGGRWSIADFKMPSNELSVLAPLLALVLVRAFGGSVALADRHPWESVDRYTDAVELTEFYMGFAYVVVGTRGESAVGRRLDATPDDRQDGQE